jgi:23S rRNA pseudouridine2457 synthase
MAIGRLDEDSEGLLPNYRCKWTNSVEKVDKEYYVQVDGVITEEAMRFSK